MGIWRHFGTLRWWTYEINIKENLNTTGGVDFVMQPFQAGEKEGRLELLLVNFERVIRKFNKFSVIVAVNENHHKFMNAS
jgi:hypothetical protein